ncbi:MAG: hypothetical protein AAF280_02650 [Pseudomonadota bacterium]
MGRWFYSLVSKELHCVALTQVNIRERLMNYSEFGRHTGPVKKDTCGLLLAFMPMHHSGDVTLRYRRCSAGTLRDGAQRVGGKVRKAVPGFSITARPRAKDKVAHH